MQWCSVSCQLRLVLPARVRWAHLRCGVSLCATWHFKYSWDVRISYNIIIYIYIIIYLYTVVLYIYSIDLAQHLNYFEILNISEAWLCGSWISCCRTLTPPSLAPPRWTLLPIHSSHLYQQLGPAMGGPWWALVGSELGWANRCSSDLLSYLSPPHSWPLR